MKIYKLIRGYIRCRVFSFCPKCNSDAPALYDCDICHYNRVYPQTRRLRKQWWEEYKKQIGGSRGLWYLMWFVVICVTAFVLLEILL